MTWPPPSARASRNTHRSPEHPIGTTAEPQRGSQRRAGRPSRSGRHSRWRAQCHPSKCRLNIDTRRRRPDEQPGTNTTPDLRAYRQRRRGKAGWDGRSLLSLWSRCCLQHWHGGARKSMAAPSSLSIRSTHRRNPRHPRAIDQRRQNTRIAPSTPVRRLRSSGRSPCTKPCHAAPAMLAERAISMRPQGLSRRNLADGQV